MPSDDKPISPMRLAKLLNIRPQEIYGLIRQGRIKDVGEGGKKLVIPSEVIAARNTPRKVGRPSTDSILEGFNTKKGDMLVWVAEIHKQVAVVDSVGETLLQTKGFLGKRPTQTIIKKTSLAQYVKDGDYITAEDNWALLEAIIYSWEIKGQMELAKSLSSWLAANREENSDDNISSGEDASEVPSIEVT